jgi:UV DNA damage endonuclease
MTSRFGYCCINTTLQKKKITCNRTMRKATFLEKGINYASELFLKNVIDLEKIIIWNAQNDIKLFRISSDIAPWFSEYDFDSLPDAEQIATVLNRTGNFAINNNMRLTMHPGPYNCLASSKESVIENAIKDLSMHGFIMDVLQQPRSHQAVINIHIGGAYGDRKLALKTWRNNFNKLPQSVKSRLTVENDDKASMYSTKMLYEEIYQKINVPVVFDSLHFKCGPQDSTYDEAFTMAIDSWPTNIKPVCHHSSSKKTWEDPSISSKTAHADYCYEQFNDLGYSVDIELETKAKEKAWFKYRNDYYSDTLKTSCQTV